MYNSTQQAPASAQQGGLPPGPAHTQAAINYATQPVMQHPLPQREQPAVGMMAHVHAVGGSAPQPIVQPAQPYPPAGQAQMQTYQGVSVQNMQMGPQHAPPASYAPPTAMATSPAPYGQQPQAGAQFNQPYGQAAKPAAHAPENFKTTLLGCCQDPGVCCFGWLCLPILFGDNHNRIHGTGCCVPALMCTFCPCFAWAFAGSNRQSIRAKYALNEEPASDCCIHLWCSPCAICQETRELNIRSTATAQKLG